MRAADSVRRLPAEVRRKLDVARRIAFCLGDREIRALRDRVATVERIANRHPLSPADRAELIALAWEPAVRFMREEPHFRRLEKARSRAAIASKGGTARRADSRVPDVLRALDVIRRQQPKLPPHRWVRELSKAISLSESELRKITEKQRSAARKTRNP